jgi:type 1 glutamine amidotransferase
MVRIALLVLTLLPGAFGEWKALLIDGQNNHKWQETTPLIRRALESTGLFSVDVVTTAAKGEDLSGFQPNFAAYRVVVSNYNGDPWPAPVKTAFEKYMRGGGGFVSVHAANNSFPEWTAYNEMIALGGWGGRTEQHGPYAKFRDGRLQLDASPGKGGHHGKRHEFVVETRNAKHPIMKGLSAKWMHAEDELYDSLRGPARNINLLATAYSDPGPGGTGEHEPMLFTVSWGKGRIFHTTLGHDVKAMSCAGFIVTLQRGAEWAATGKVTQKTPSDFPSADRVSVR